VAEARLRTNGMSPMEIAELDEVFKRKRVEDKEMAAIYLDPGNQGVGGPIFKIKEERYL
jgi:hypothetical protein